MTVSRDLEIILDMNLNSWFVHFLISSLAVEKLPELQALAAMVSKGCPTSLSLNEWMNEWKNFFAQVFGSKKKKGHKNTWAAC